MYSYQGWCYMARNIGCLDVVFSLTENSKRESLSLLMNSVNYCPYFSKSTNMFLSDDHYGPSTLSLHSRGLKIKPQCAVMSGVRGEHCSDPRSSCCYASSLMPSRTSSRHPNKGFWDKIPGYLLPFAGSLWHKGAYNWSFLCMEARTYHAITT